MQDLWQGQEISVLSKVSRLPVCGGDTLPGGGIFEAACICIVLTVGVSAAILPILQYAHTLCVHNV